MQKIRFIYTQIHTMPILFLNVFWEKH